MTCICKRRKSNDSIERQIKKDLKKLKFGLTIEEYLPSNLHPQLKKLFNYLAESHNELKQYNLPANFKTVIKARFILLKHCSTGTLLDFDECSSKEAMILLLFFLHCLPKPLLQCAESECEEVENWVLYSNHKCNNFSDYYAINNLQRLLDRVHKSEYEMILHLIAFIYILTHDRSTNKFHFLTLDNIIRRISPYFFFKWKKHESQERRAIRYNMLSFMISKAKSIFRDLESTLHHGNIGIWKQLKFWKK